MDVLPAVKGVDQGRVFRHVRQDPEFDLGVVRPDQGVLRIVRHEGLAKEPSELGTDRDVLKVWFYTADPAGCRDGLHEVGVDLAILRIDQRDEAIDIGAL